MRNREEKRLQRVVTSVCATLFAVFAFLFVGVYQAPLVEAFYNEVSTGKLDYNPYLVGGIVSLVLSLCALWLNRFANLCREWTALAFLPSALMLAFITDIDRGLYTGAAFSCSWIFIFASGLLVYFAVSFILRRVLFEKIKDVRTVTNRVLWRNMMLLVLIICLVGTLSNGDGDFKRETQVMSHLSRGDTDKALRVGKSSLDASRELTVMRAYVLVPMKQRTSPLVPDSVYSLLGAVPFDGESASDFFYRVAHTDSATSVAKDYWLTSLLLDKRLVEFKDEVLAEYGVEAADSLPKHYSEALMLYADIADSTEVLPFRLNDEAMRAKLDKLRLVESKHSDAFIRGNFVRRGFGRTYWWYFLYFN